MFWTRLLGSFTITGIVLAVFLMVAGFSYGGEFTYGSITDRRCGPVANRSYASLCRLDAAATLVGTATDVCGLTKVRW